MYAISNTWWKFADWLLEFPSSLLSFVAFKNTDTTRDHVLCQWHEHCALECSTLDQQESATTNRSDQKNVRRRQSTAATVANRRH
jgi:hypothetical protein